VFHPLTGLKYPTGNWCGKTVAGAEGFCTYKGQRIRLTDTPGTYSLFSQTAEERAAAEVILQTPHDCIICICDATAPERGIRLALELLQLHCHVVLGLNLMDEARAKQIEIDLGKLSELLGIPVIGLTAKRKKTVLPLLDAAMQQAAADSPAPFFFSPETEQAIKEHADAPSRFAAITALLDSGNGSDISGALLKRAAVVCQAAVRVPESAGARTRLADRILTHRFCRIPLMLLFLVLVFWLTLAGTNYPSQWLLALTGRLCDLADRGAAAIALPAWLSGALIDGMLRGTGWVISVMLPPMAVFFPLFTLLEDIGLLPRIAFNADRCFARCHACGKQCLTMAMGFGCNAVGVTGCRIMTSRRERLIAILTNAFVPCNGRLPTLLAIITCFFAGSASGANLRAALMLTGLTVLSVLMTLTCSALLSRTLLRGEPSSFVLELPPFRRPRIGQILVHSVLDRTVFVLGRAAVTAAPVSLLIWVLANVQTGGHSLLLLTAGALAPVGRLLGLDGVTVLAFLLGIPANEIILPVAVTSYLGSTVLTEVGAGEALFSLLSANGWTLHTAAAFLVLMLFHSPCATTLLTVKKETGSVRWMLLSMLLPTAVGAVLCLLMNGIFLFAA
jgi:ferrous iron transport protein B